MSILPYDIDITSEVIGTGPYRLMDLNEDVLVLAAFDFYFGIRPLLDRVEIWYLPKEASNERQYQLPDPEHGELLPDIISNHSIDYPALGCRYILFNFHRENSSATMVSSSDPYPLQSNGFNKELGGNRITPADSFLPWESSKRELLDPTLEHAQALLVENGYQGEVITLATKDKKKNEKKRYGSKHALPP